MGKIIGIDLGTTNSCVAIMDGDKVKVTLRFRGREMAHQNLGRELLERVAEDVKEVGKIENKGKSNRRISIILV